MDSLAGIRFKPALLLFAFSASLSLWAFAGAPLTFEERVKAQEAIERVYYRHRIWPKENPGSKPPFEQTVPKEAIEAKVSDYLKKSEALDKFWQRPIKPDQLQAEMERMARQSRDRSTLGELFAALGNDPYLIAECIARPALVERQIHNWYNFDERFHREAKNRAINARRESQDASLSSLDGGAYYLKRFLLEGRQKSITFGVNEKYIETYVAEKDWYKTVKNFGEVGRTSKVEEMADTFVLTRTLKVEDGLVEIEVRAFPKRGFSDWWDSQVIEAGPEIYPHGDQQYILPILPEDTICDPEWVNSALSVNVEWRGWHTAVWTGSEMIVWGGANEYLLDSGNRYNPSTDTWLRTSKSESTPVERCWHTAVWTGSEMVIWGGSGSGTEDYLNSGGRYSPVTDTWRPTSTGAGCPVGRVFHTAVWTGKEMIVWGGYSHESAEGRSNTGGRYDPLADSWRATSTTSGCPSPREYHTAVWTGSEMVVWGGATPDGATGGCYSPSTNSWRPTSTGPNCPSGRSDHTAVWTGEEMIIWGGESSHPPLNNGSKYDPSNDSWSLMNSGTWCPSGRYGHTAVWTGSEMIVWGGYGDAGKLGDGGRYSPFRDAWQPTAQGGANPSPRMHHTAVWTGDEMIIFGGSELYDPGGRYSPASGTWVALPLGCGGVLPTWRPAGVWTGSEMVVWVGRGMHSGSYTPSLDEWRAMPEAGAPSSTSYIANSVVWTGSEVVVWGGDALADVYKETDEGGRYSPASGRWVLTARGGACPSARAGHVAVWTGREMVIWGGEARSTGNSFVTGGRYDPAGNTWRATSTGGGCPRGGAGVTAVWTGNEMIVWGGYEPVPGGLYNASDDTWRPISTGANSPSARTGHTAVWTGNEMIIWGGHSTRMEYSGGRYYPETDSWFTTSTGGTSLKARENHSAVWTGSEMIVWGGLGEDDLHLGSGALYSPMKNGWAKVTAVSQPEPREGHLCVWTGGDMLIWGGSMGLNDNWSGGGVLHYNSPIPSVTGPRSGCSQEGVTLSTGEYGAYQWIKNSFWIEGATSQLYTAFSSGNYAVRVTDDRGCQGDSGIHRLSIKPEIPTISGPSDSCEGFPITLTTAPQAAYQWRRDGADIAGATDISFEISASGAYAVRVTEAGGCQGTSEEKIVAFHPSPTPAISGENEGCAEVGVALVTQGYQEYQWFLNGAEIPQASEMIYLALKGGSYKVAVVDAFGCKGESGAHDVTIFESPTPSVLGPDSGCSSPGVVLTTENYSSYQWLKDGAAVDGATHRSYTATEGGSFTVAVADANGCKATSPGHDVAVAPSPSPSVNGADEGCEGLSILLGTGSYSSFQWFKDGVEIPGATGSGYSATETGNYAVVVVAENGCGGTSAPKAVVFHPAPAPSVEGSHSGCRSSGVVLSTQAFSNYQWKTDGSEIPGATLQSLNVIRSGSFSVDVTDSNGCRGSSPLFPVAIRSCVPGDCDDDGSVSIGELQKAINMFLGALAPDCGVDCDGDGKVSIGELQKVVNAYLGMERAC